MTGLTFVRWVEPIAGRLAQSKQEIEQVARDIPEDAWSEPSAYPGWSYKDHLSHLPESYRGLQSVLGAVIERRDPDFSRFDRIDEINEKNRQKHLATPVVELLDSMAAEGQQIQQLLSELGPEDADNRLGPMTLSQALQGFMMHDVAHLEELREGLQA